MSRRGDLRVGGPDPDMNRHGDVPDGGGGCSVSEGELARIVCAIAERRLPAPLVAEVVKLCSAPGELTRVVRVLLADDHPDIAPALTSLVSRAVGLPPSPGVFRCRGDYWELAYAGDSVLMHDAKGLRYIGSLLAQPGEAIGADDLVSRHGGRQRGDLARISVTKAIKGVLARLAAVHPRLAGHLSSSIRRGATCRYDADHPVTWET